jgi:hypothetical protein
MSGLKNFPILPNRDQKYLSPCDYRKKGISEWFNPILGDSQKNDIIMNIIDVLLADIKKMCVLVNERRFFNPTDFYDKIEDKQKFILYLKDKTKIEPFSGLLSELESYFFNLNDTFYKTMYEYDSVNFIKILKKILSSYKKDQLCDLYNKLRPSGSSGSSGSSVSSASTSASKGSKSSVYIINENRIKSEHPELFNKISRSDELTDSDLKKIKNMSKRSYIKTGEHEYSINSSDDDDILKGIDLTDLFSRSEFGHKRSSKRSKRSKRARKSSKSSKRAVLPQNGARNGPSIPCGARKRSKRSKRSILK